VSETLKKVKLDAALRAWPEADKPAMDWEQMAQRIEERVAAGYAGATAPYVSDEKLLAEPLGQIDGEGHNSAATAQPVETRVSKGETMTMPVDRERDRRSLQDLAKMAATGMTPPPPSVKAPSSSAPSGVQRAAEAKKDDSGIVDLAAAAQSDPQGAVRAQTTPLAKDGLFDDEPASVQPGPVSTQAQAAPLSQQPQQPAPSIPPFATGPASAPPASLSSPLSAPLSAPQSFVPASQATVAAAPKKKSGSGKVIALVFGGLVAASAVAAGGFFLVQQHNAKKAAELALNTPTTPPATPTIATAAPEEPKPAEATNPAPDPSLDPNTLPDGKLATAPKGAVKAAPPPAPLAKNDKPAPPKPEETAKVSQKDLPTTPAGPAGDLGAAMKGAVGDDGKQAQTPAAASTGSQFAAGTVPQKPSQGAVTGAIGAVLPGARACLGPDDPVSRAAITFTSAGTVQSVNVSGGAAGKPAEGCIKAALSKAKVAPFAEPTYTANITVRH
jgi:hypothetical protein